MAAASGRPSLRQSSMWMMASVAAQPLPRSSVWLSRASLRTAAPESPGGGLCLTVVRLSQTWLRPAASAWDRRRSCARAPPLGWMECRTCETF